MSPCSLSPTLCAHQWLTSNVQDEHSPHKDFPPPDLLEMLVDLYFRNMNDYMPLLHRPTFEQGIKEGLHHHDEGFGSTVLLVCANGARFTDDPRVLLDDHQIPQSAGWKWFQQVQMVRKSLLAPPRLYDLQIYAVRQGRLQMTSNSPEIDINTVLFSLLVMRVRRGIAIPCSRIASPFAFSIGLPTAVDGGILARYVCTPGVLDDHWHRHPHGPGCRRT